jgi:DNA-binding FrmR family transcriptional regulator
MVMSHADNLDIHNRLRRAEGHLSTVVRMVAQGRDGLVIAQQMQAVIKALEKAKQMLILDHIDHHLEEITGPLSPDAREQIAAFRDIVKYL